MCFASLTDSVVDPVTFSGDLTAFPPHIASVGLAHPVLVLIIGMPTVSAFAETSFSGIRRHFEGLGVKQECRSEF